ncbi:hypothetical protein LTR28_013940 [Elasticomyces elasticus]|nr:hypothetical protein LTR28_013940 [Elasticomyces elasticus]
MSRVRTIVDASVRRFKAQRIYLRATAVLRWVNSRNVILRGQKIEAVHVPALHRIQLTLQTELASISDERVELSLRAADSAQGKWIAEDPNLATIQHLIHTGR